VKTHTINLIELLDALDILQLLLQIVIEVFLSSKPSPDKVISNPPP
jgi:Tfp pilus assembly protein PilW